MTSLTADWQTVAVAVIVAAAFLYVARRAVARLRSLVGGGRGPSSDCAAGCGKCGGEVSRNTSAGETLVQIKPHAPPREGRR